MRNSRGKVDNYTYIILSVLFMVFGVLMLLKIMPADFTSGILANKPEISGVLFIGIGVVLLVIGIKNEIKRRNNLKSSYYVIKKMSDEEIKNRMVLLDERITIERKKDFISISCEREKFLYELTIHEDSFYIGIDCLNEEDYDLLSEEEKKKIDDTFYDGNPLEVNEREILDKFVSFVNTNR